MIWNNSYVKILVRTLKIVEFEVAKVSTKHLLLDNLGPVWGSCAVAGL